MFLAWIGRIVALFAVLTAVYIGLSIYNRWTERRRLEHVFLNRNHVPVVPIQGNMLQC